MFNFKRLILHKFWIQQNIMKFIRRFLHVLDSYRHINDSLKKCYQELNLRCFFRAYIIDVTIINLTQNLNILRRVRTKVMIFKEAKKVLKTHILIAFLSFVEHVILIEDHEQLRPQINNYEFQYDNLKSAKFFLNISFFERLIQS